MAVMVCLMWLLSDSFSSYDCGGGCDGRDLLIIVSSIWWKLW